VTTEKSASLVRASMKLEDKWMQWIIAAEYKGSACEELTQFDYSKIDAVRSTVELGYNVIKGT
jgi:hypothetical protein